MLEFFANSWVVGIITGLVSGLIVFFITNKFMKKKNDILHNKQIISANDEVRSILKPYVADTGLPNTKIFSAIISSVARKYGIEVSEMYDIKTFCEELIKEIVDNAYISNETKNEYTSQIEKYIKMFERVQKKNSINIDEEKIRIRDGFIEKYRVIISGVFSIVIGIYTSLLSYLLNDNLQKMIMLFVCLLIVVVFALALFLMYIKRKKQDNIYKNK